MIQVRLYSEGDTETIALMPDMGSAIEWVRAAYVDFPPGEGQKEEVRCGGDIYAVREDGRQTLLLTDGVILTVESRDLVSDLITEVMEGRCQEALEIARELRDRRGL